MDDFGVKHFSGYDVNHLLNSLKQHHTISTDWEGRNYFILKIDWNYIKEYVDVPMTDYARKALDRLQHIKPKRPQYDLHCWSVPANGKRLQMAADLDNSNLIVRWTTKIIHSMVSTMLFYTWSLDPMMLREIKKNLRVQSRPRQDIEEKEIMLLDYAATYPNAIIRYKARDMVLLVDSDAE